MAVIYGSEKSEAPVGVVADDPLYEQVRRHVDASEASTTEWSHKQEKYHRMRMGIKKKKTFPFKNSSNIRIPTAEKVIRKVKAGILQTIFGIRPVVQVEATPTGNRESALKIEKLLDHLVMDVIRLDRRAEIGVDKSLEHGFYLANPYWRLEIEEREEEVDLRELPIEEAIGLLTAPKEMVARAIVDRLEVDLHDRVFDENMREIERGINAARSGEMHLKLSILDLTYNFPDVDFISPERVYVSTDSGFDVQRVTRVTIEKFVPFHIAKANVESKGWDASVVQFLDEYKGADPDKLTDDQKDMREGVDRLNRDSELVRVWESYGYFEKDGKMKKMVVTSFPDFSRCVRKVLINTPSGQYPLVKLYYELSDDRWFHHRGIPEMLEDIIKEIDVQHNMKIDAQTMRNAPMVLYRAGAVDPRRARVNPAEAIPVQGTSPLNDMVTAVNLHNPNAEFSYEREQQILELQIQELVGQVDFSLNSMINRREPRTLGEVQQQVQSAGGLFGLDVSHYRHSFQDLFEKIYELWVQNGEDEYEFLYFGQKPEGERIRISKEELQGKYTIKVRGNDQNTNPQIKIQKAQQILQGVTNPLFLQTGVVGPQQIVEGLKRFYQALDIEGWEMLINGQPQPPQQDPRASIEAKFEDLTDSEKAQVLAAKGIVADSPGRKRRQEIEGLETAANVASRIG